MSRHATPAAIEALYRQRFRVFVRAMTAQLGDADVARDIVQEAFATALRHRDGFRGEGSLETWVWRIVVNKALDERRRRAGASHLRLLPEAEADTGNGDAEDTRVIRARLAALPERQRLALFLHYYADLDYEAIATALGVAPGTVAATLNAARASLRRRMKEEIP